MRSINQQTAVALADYLTRAAELVKSGLAKSPSDLGNLVSGLMAIARSMDRSETEDDPDWQFAEGECLSRINTEILTYLTRDNGDWWEELFAKVGFLPEQVRG
jgi:hypothetical protein